MNTLPPSSYTIRHNARSTSLKLRVDSDSNVIVTAPPRANPHLIEEFVTAHHMWITQQQEKMASIKRQRKHRAVIFGQPYNTQLLSESSKPLGTYIFQDKLVINMIPDKPNEPLVWNEKCEKAVDRFVKTAAHEFMIPRTEQWAKKMKTDISGIQFKEMSSRWGSCSHTGMVTFNWRLAHCLPGAIEYVIIHELAHRTEFNHSPRFWDIVEKFDPEYKKHRRMLKTFSRHLAL